MSRSSYQGLLNLKIFSNYNDYIEKVNLFIDNHFINKIIYYYLKKGNIHIYK